MGNVFAASAPSMPIGMAPMPPPTAAPTTGAGDSSILPPVPPTEHKDVNERNPGTMEDLHKKCKDVFPVNFEGAKLMINKGLSNHFQISHTLNMSSAFPVLLGDIDPSGNLNANIIHQFNSNIRCKFAAQVQGSKFLAAQFTSDYRGKDFTGSLTFGNPDIINESGVAVAHYLQSVSTKISLGAELAYQYGPQVPGGEIAVLSLASRFTADNYTVSGTLGGAGVHVCYYHKASDQLQLGVEVETNFRLQESVASIGYQIDLPKANL
uniref:Uncharacterized protein n=1 Tax=Strigamia maritima TaxID=126957 RepID=T1IQW4_STRMM